MRRCRAPRRRQQSLEASDESVDSLAQGRASVPLKTAQDGKSAIQVHTYCWAGRAHARACTPAQRHARMKASHLMAHPEMRLCNTALRDPPNTQALSKVCEPNPARQLRWMLQSVPSAPPPTTLSPRTAFCGAARKAVHVLASRARACACLQAYTHACSCSRWWSSQLMPHHPCPAALCPCPCCADGQHAHAAGWRAAGPAAAAAACLGGHQLPGLALCQAIPHAPRVHGVLLLAAPLRRWVAGAGATSLGVSHNQASIAQAQRSK